MSSDDPATQMMTRGGGPERTVELKARAPTVQLDRVGERSGDLHRGVALSVRCGEDAGTSQEIGGPADLQPSTGPAKGKPMKPRYPDVRASRTYLGCVLRQEALLIAPPASAGGLFSTRSGPQTSASRRRVTRRAHRRVDRVHEPGGHDSSGGTQTTLAMQDALRRSRFSIGPGHARGTGRCQWRHPVGWFPGGGASSPTAYRLTEAGIRATGNFGLSASYDAPGRPYWVQEPTAVGCRWCPRVAVPSQPAMVGGAGLNAMYAKMRAQVAVNNVQGDDGQLVFSEYQWGFGGNLGVLYERAAARASAWYGIRRSSSISPAPPQSPAFPLLEAALRKRGLYDANIDLRVTVPQGVDASSCTRSHSRWTLLR